VYGAPSQILSGNCLPGSGVYVVEQCAFRNGIDVNNFELKNLYVDFSIPQLPIANRIQLGGIPADVTPLHPNLLYTIDAGGGSVKLGEDYIAGATLMLRPLPLLDLHLLGIFGHLQAPFGETFFFGGPFIGLLQPPPMNVTTEDRYYIGFDARYRIGNMTIEPTFASTWV
jgi:hypothetical protein